MLVRSAAQPREHWTGPQEIQLPPEEVEQSLAAPRGGRKVRTPQGRVAASGGPERSGESATERRQPRAFGRGATVKR